ncbi:MAG: type II toxin-antitoxin system VapC family toxin [Tessaracoccus sp.]
MIVPDASVTALLFVDAEADSRVLAARRLLMGDPVWVVPEPWCTEVLSVIRGLWLGRKLDDRRAERAVQALRTMVVDVVPAGLLLPRMWELRSSLTAYDASYVAAAELRSCALVTADARIARSGAARCEIELI